VSLQMRGTPPDATVTIDDRIVGSLALLSAHGVALPPGKHRISVEARGYLPFDRIVVAPASADPASPARPIPLDVALVPVPD
jgi:PEGA domain